MGVADRLLIQAEQVAQILSGEMSLHVLLFVHHTAAQRFFVSLALEDLLLYRTGLYSDKHKKYLQSKLVTSPFFQALTEKLE